jgi:hypothetical protein
MQKVTINAIASPTTPISSGAGMAGEPGGADGDVWGIRSLYTGLPDVIPLINI